MLPRIHLVTEVPVDRVAYLDLLAEIVGVGVDAVQIRAKQLTDRELLEFACAATRRLQPLGAKLIVNDRVDIALAAGADGVHLGLDDLPIAAARALAGPDLMIGGTCRNADQAHSALAAGADYVGVGPVFTTTSKAGLPAPLSLSTVTEVASVIPAVAISGITVDRAPALIRTGVHGIAVIGAISRARDPVSAAAALVEAVRSHAGQVTG